MFSSMLVAALSVFGMATATPINFSRQTSSSAMCSPNFEGASVSVTNSAREWAVASSYAGADVIAPTGTLTTTDFRFEQNGQPAVSYTIKDINSPDNGLAVSVREDGTLQLDNVKADIAQEWNVVCDNCSSDISQSKGGPVSFGCNITSIATGYCVEISGDRTAPMFIAPCNGQDSQNFDFWTAVPI